MESERKVILKIFFFIGIASVLSRRYDVEEESKRLYGEDLKNVLLQFRRTPAYKKILDNVVQNNLYGDIFSLAFMQSIVHHEQRMYERLPNVLGKHLFGEDALDDDKDDNYDKNPNFNATIHTRAQKRIQMRSYLHKLPRNYFRANDARKSIDIETSTFATEEERVDNLTKRLDDYVKAKLEVNPDVYNKVMNISYEFAGDAIKDIIKHISLDEEVHSTKSDDSTNPTTRHLRNARTRGPRRHMRKVPDRVSRDVPARRDRWLLFPSVYE